MKKIAVSLLLLLFFHKNLNARADNEIQVYASPTIGHKRTIVELHSNYTFKGIQAISNSKDARWLNETLEITTGIVKKWELGFYTFTGKNPNGGY